jgi:hypothetical protein
VFVKAVVAVAVASVLVAGGQAPPERVSVGRYSTPDAVEPVAVREAPRVAAPVAPVVVTVAPPPAPVTAAVPVRKPAPKPPHKPPPPPPAPEPPVVPDLSGGGMCAQPDEPNCGDPNGAGGWEPDPEG